MFIIDFIRELFFPTYKRPINENRIVQAYKNAKFFNEK